MKILYSVRFPLKRRSSLLTTLVLLAAILAQAGCAVRLIGDYDDTIDKGISDVQQNAELYFAKLKSDPNTPMDQNFYNDTSARLAVLKTRAAALPKYSIISEQIANLQSQFDKLQQLDKITKRPFPADAVTAADSAITVSVESILKLELALKRGATPSAASK